MATVTETRFKVQVHRAELLRALKKLCPLASGRTIPVLRGVLLEVGNDGLLWATTTNLEIALKVGISAVVEDTGSLVVPAKELALACEFGTGELVELRQEKNFSLHVFAGMNEVTIMGFTVDQFPQPIDGLAPWFTIGRTDLQEMGSAISATVGHDESKPWLTGVFLTTTNGETLAAVSTDGARIGEWVKPLNIQGRSNCICLPGAMKLAGQMAAPGEEVAVLRTENQVRFVGHSWEVTSRLIDGAYPDVRRYIPKDQPISATVDRADILSACNMGLRWGSANPYLQVNLLALGLKVSMEVPEVGGWARRMTGTVKGAIETVGLDSALLTPVVKALGGKEITFGFTKRYDPVLIVSPEQPHIRFVVMPLRNF